MDSDKIIGLKTIKASHQTLNNCVEDLSSKVSNNEVLLKHIQNELDKINLTLNNIMNS